MAMNAVRVRAQGAPNTAAPVPRNPAYQRIATEEAWITAEIADESMRFIASKPTDEPGFVSFGARYFERGAASPAVAPQDPAKAAQEIERGLRQLGLKGVIINSHTKGEYLDDPAF